MTVLPGVISYPIPAFQNFPIDADFYQPSRFVVTNVTLGQTTIVTTSIANNYVIGQQVRLLIPATFGCFQLNNSQGYVLSLPSSTQIEISIDSSVNVNTYIASSAVNKPQILAIGNNNSGQININDKMQTTYVQGSFINISPQ